MILNKRLTRLEIDIYCVLPARNTPHQKDKHRLKKIKERNGKLYSKQMELSIKLYSYMTKYIFIYVSQKRLLKMVITHW